jgi:hypothetical protein
MAKLILHEKSLTREGIEERRLIESLQRTPEERIKRMFALMELAVKFKKGPLKEPQGNGIVLKQESRS